MFPEGPGKEAAPFSLPGSLLGLRTCLVSQGDGERSSQHLFTCKATRHAPLEHCRRPCPRSF